ncbi:hypothetical protein [Paenibacillus harenae]|uniref:hypothetical protein n=1 Tax=Paenibacillus harenae TaxID=306543 RepID=UPI00278EC988|nr:hypothetical protein [Paenibacillus harenae]MDQ0058369.1 hypothetical protein [Paenibacillus harenae]
MQLFQFLLDNIVAVVIALGFVATLLGKVKEKRKPGQTASFGGQPAPDRTEELQEERRRQIEGRHAALESERQRAYEADLELGRRVVDRNAREEARRASEADRASHAHRGQRSSPIIGGAKPELRAEDIRRAVVWAEILGPPRAKRPFRK